jgi:Aromatic-ring-opening dioxygenase LigAB, LigA subunit
MSIYAVNYLCRETLRDHAFREAMRSDPRKAVAGLPLTEREREALIAGEVGELYAMGANAFLLGYLLRFELVGLTLDSYRAKLRAAAKLD